MITLWGSNQPEATQASTGVVVVFITPGGIRANLIYPSSSVATGMGM